VLRLTAAAVGILSPVLQLLTWAGALVGADVGSAVQAGYWFIICGWWLWRRTQHGRTGQTLGQELVGVWIVDEASGMPIGPGRTILRGLTHVLDLAPAGLGLLRPAWDRQRQTWADRVHHTIAITADQAAVSIAAREVDVHVPAAVRALVVVSVRLHGHRLAVARYVSSFNLAVAEGWTRHQTSHQKRCRSHGCELPHSMGANLL
jgi:RDD family